VVFEDSDANFGTLEREFRVASDDAFELIRYDGNRELPSADWRIVEDWIREALLMPEAATLIILDWDLTGFHHPAVQQLVRGITEDLAIPTVLYQGPTDKDRRLERLQRWQERRIAVESTCDHGELARVCAEAARAFRDIRAAVLAAGSAPRLLETLRDILHPPSSTPLYLSQFAVGNQELLRIVSEKSHEAEYQRFIATWAGYLIHNRLLAFPGPVLGVVATAAYLAIDPEELRGADVRDWLASAKYTGPFSGEDRWWRGSIDECIAREMSEHDMTVPLGRDLLTKVLGRQVRPARCHDDHSLNEPGFQCVLNRDIVCRDHSEAPDAWIPQGADRCRIHTDELEALQAWLGI
jgi:hypothetical protein